jgi:hypothetical protein
VRRRALRSMPMRQPNGRRETQFSVLRDGMRKAIYNAELEVKWLKTIMLLGPTETEKGARLPMSNSHCYLVHCETLVPPKTPLTGTLTEHISTRSSPLRYSLRCIVEIG